MSIINPVQHKVPSSNDYKNINITNFKGTSYSDNLFDGKQSGCSESENVYVNEQNILAVRPRLEHAATFENIKEIKNINIINNNEMVYTVKDFDDNINLIFSDKDNPGEQENDKKIQLNDSNKFDKHTIIRDGNNELIIASDTNLYTHHSEGIFPIKNNTLKAYIPTIKTGMTFGNEFSGVETGELPNMLASKYYNEYSYSLNSLDYIPKSYIENRKFDLENMIEISHENNSAIKGPISPNFMYIDYNSTLLFSLYSGSSDSVYKYESWLENTVPTEISLKSKTLDGLKIWPLFNKNRLGIVGNYLYVISRIVCREPESGGTDKLVLELNKINIWNNSITVIHHTVNLNTKVLYDNLDKDDVFSNYDVKLYKTEDNKLYVGIIINIRTDENKPWSSYYTTAKINTTLDGSSEWYETNENCELYTLINSSLTRYKKITDMYLSDEDEIYTTLVTLDNSTTDLDPVSFNIVKTDTITKTHSLTLADDVVYTDYNNNDLKTIKINDNKLIVIPGKTSETKDVFNKLPLNGSNTIYIIDINKKDVEIYTNDDFYNSTFYKIKNTTSVIIIQSKTNAQPKIKLYTNISKDSGGFDISKDIIDSVDLVNLGTILGIITQPDENNLSLGIVIQGSIYNLGYSINITLKDSSKMSITEIVKHITKESVVDYTKIKFIDNRLWLYGSSTKPNRLRWSFATSGFYFPEDYYTDIGSGDSITNVIPLSNSTIGVFQKNSTTVLSEDDNGFYKWQNTLKTPKGCLGEDQAVIIPTTNYPMVINDDSVAILTQSENGVVEDSVFTILSEDIFEKFSIIKDKQKIKTHVHGYYIYLYWTDDNKTTDIWCLDCRTNSWFKWKLPIVVKFMYESDNSTDNNSEVETRLITNSDEFRFININYFKEYNDDTKFNEDYDCYLDHLDSSGTFRRIPWKWKSRIQTLGSVNYLKKIVSLQLMFSDKARRVKEEGLFNKNNSLFFGIKTYRKKSKLLNGSFSTHLDGVGIKRLKIRLPKCDFAEILLSNYSDNSEQFDHVSMFSNGEMVLLEGTSDDVFKLENYEGVHNTFDRLHLIGITLKIILSEGLNG